MPQWGVGRVLSCREVNRRRVGIPAGPVTQSPLENLTMLCGKKRKYRPGDPAPEPPLRRRLLPAWRDLGSESPWASIIAPLPGHQPEVALGTGPGQDPLWEGPGRGREGSSAGIHKVCCMQKRDVSPTVVQSRVVSQSDGNSGGAVHGPLWSGLRRQLGFGCDHHC